MKGVHWRERAMCRTTPRITEKFFIEGKYPMNSFEQRDAIAVAKSYCALCPVRQQCLEFALLMDEDSGIYGGMTRNERRHFIRRPQPLQPQQREEVAA